MASYKSRWRMSIDFRNGTIWGSTNPLNSTSSHVHLTRQRYIPQFNIVIILIKAGERKNNKKLEKKKNENISYCVNVLLKYELSKQDTPYHLVTTKKTPHHLIKIAQQFQHNSIDEK
ncbi:hypothetical protein HELRODRAFT_170991 [Helobdella robusta]|uniref:Uncharacterized protein n=1 Tax=Helobdella robusta TaxID=6412 RepID=T1F3N8_HELRO|nr:hypothetical protein HELRODRAFT_170991 [Helobdella robusta]ESO06955.1 hypothetical protein HELRODRAFT_170991 [Helobdella robusta]